MTFQRVILIVGIVLGLAGCGTGIIVMQRAIVAPFIVPGASEVAAVWNTPGSMSITYRTAGEPFGWRGALARQLEADGWAGRSYTNMGARRPPFSTIWYTSERTVGPVLVVERAIFGGNPDDPNLAIVEVTRQIVLR